MANRPSGFKQTDLVRIYKAAEKAGLAPDEFRLRIINGETSEIIIEPMRSTPNLPDHNDWDDVL